MVVGAVTLGLLFLGGARLLHLAGLIPMFLIAVGVLIWKSPYRLQRLSDLSRPDKGSDRRRLSSQSIVPGVRKRRAFRCRIGGGQTKTVFSSGGAY